MLKHDLKQDLIVRIGFVLGNITSRHEDARIQFMHEKYSLDTIIKTMKLYSDLDAVNCLVIWNIWILSEIKVLK